MAIEPISTKEAPAAIGPYSQAVRVDNLLFVSGQIPLIPESGQLHSGSIEEQTQQVLQNLGAILKEAGTDFGNVVRTTIFLKDLSHFNQVNEVYGTFFREPFPARACVEVSKLPKDVDVEIDAIAKV